MKTPKLLGLVVVGMLLTLATANLALADLNASEIVNNFNSLNSNYGLMYQYSSVNSETNIAVRSGTDAIDGSAYKTSISTGSNTYFRTFCVEPSVGATTYGTGKLNYNGTTTANTAGKVLTVGAAYLYKLFATGEFASSLYYYSNSSVRSSDAGDLRLAIQRLMDLNTSASWTSNKFLQYLTSINADQSFWTAAYNPNQYYDFIGNYSVFVMNSYSTTGTGNYQDFLYLAPATNNSTTPEPATLLLWTLGSAGVVGINWLRKRK